MSEPPKRQRSRRLDLTPAEEVAVAGALRRDLELPDTDHRTLRELLLRLGVGGHPLRTEIAAQP